MSQYTPEQLRKEANAWNEQGLEVTADYFRAHAAALEENERLRKHAEAMAEWIDQYAPEGVGIPCLDSYRADFPKEPR